MLDDIEIVSWIQVSVVIKTGTSYDTFIDIYGLFAPNERENESSIASR